MNDRSITLQLKIIKTLKTFAKFPRKQNIGQFTLEVRIVSIVSFCKHQIIKINSAPLVSHRWQINNSRRIVIANQHVGN